LIDLSVDGIDNTIRHATRYRAKNSNKTTYCFKKLAILSLREVAVLLRNRVNQIGIGNKEIRFFFFRRSFVKNIKIIKY
jgi:hypothetical protein